MATRLAVLDLACSGHAKPMAVLRLVMGDQLNLAISSLTDCDKCNDIILMSELKQEASYANHHKKKLVLIFSAMRHFAQELREQGYQVDYVHYTDPDNSGSFEHEVLRACERHKIQQLVVTEPSEHRVLHAMESLSDRINIQIRDDDRFLCSHTEFQHWARGKDTLRMENFYRLMRKTHNILMDGNDPIGGRWNFDSENRKTPKGIKFFPPPYRQVNDAITQQVINFVETEFKDHFGDIDNFDFAVTRQQALNVLDKFITERLALFGDFQDAMLQGEAWLYHSHIGMYLNMGLLLPLEVVQKAQQALQEHNPPINAVEGFIRQILGWREYVRGIYWLQGPQYKQLNYLDAKNDLPEFFWSADTKLNCLKQCISETKAHAYAHHIQRLMVLGNFTLLTGIEPKQVNEWYLAVYADAYEWVELPNVSGMVLYADGGLLASKPYAASGAYINKMSDYCKQCDYRVSQKNGPDACPFNYLYWNFLITNRQKFETNFRLGMSYRTLDKMSEEKRELIQSDARVFWASVTAE